MCYICDIICDICASKKSKFIKKQETKGLLSNPRY